MEEDSEVHHTVVFQLVVDFGHQRLAGMFFGALIITPPRLQGQLVEVLILIIHGYESLLHFGQFILTVQQDSAMQERKAPRH